ncbi:hypothetical protein MMC34_004115 [Xylographa carneopallida]|nr:hypothetical protein [Xylographa carneopallida]
MESLYNKLGSAFNDEQSLRDDLTAIIARLDRQHFFSSKPDSVALKPSKFFYIRDAPWVLEMAASSRPSAMDVDAASMPKDVEMQLPAKRQNSLLRNVRHKILNVYKRLFSLYVVANLIALVVFLCQSNTASLSSASTLSIPISANVLVAALSRTDYVVNVLFTSVMWIPQTAPLRLRRAVAKVYEYGGIHSGAGFSAALWVIAFTIQMTRAFWSTESFESSLLVFTYILLFFLLAICISAYPSFRRLQHNSFEAIHRFAAWISVALYWVLIMLISSSLHKQSGIPFGHMLISSPSFWILCVLTFLIVLPWLRLREVRARPEHLSKHAVRLHFDFTKIGSCQGLRISTRPLLEWHSFATIPHTSSDEFSILVSNAGDWTKANIQSPAPKYWVKGIPVTGFFQVVQLFRKVVIVTTGSGIGPCLSGLIYARKAGAPLQCRLLWSTRDAEPTYGTDVVEEVLRADPHAIILNTRPRSPRPDLVTLTYQLYVESGAEAVFIISNPKLTYKVKYGMESRGVPAYGPIFDS